ncbi:MAG TPA: metalloregulator ArsR/SmtB family transcription factor, partial [Verrucomicrobiae bacterium]
MSATLKALRALADPTRLRILALLERDELSVHEIQQITRLGQSRVSTHLSLLADTGFLTSRRDGKRTFYRLATDIDDKTSEYLQLAIRGARELPES